MAPPSGCRWAERPTQTRCRRHWAVGWARHRRDLTSPAEVRCHPAAEDPRRRAALPKGCLHLGSRGPPALHAGVDQEQPPKTQHAEMCGTRAARTEPARTPPTTRPRGTQPFSGDLLLRSESVNTSHQGNLELSSSRKNSCLTHRTSIHLFSRVPVHRGSVHRVIILGGVPPTPSASAMEIAVGSSYHHLEIFVV